MEHRQVEGRPAASRRASGDDSARFLQELRQLRDGAGLGQAELAARAHYPYDRIRAAEVGPTLPDLPVLSAYVRGCGGTSEEWEERWRSLTSAPTLPLLDARSAGCSTAASAGARIGSISPAADTPDPSIILAALDRVAEEMAVGSAAPLPSRSGVSTIEQRPGIPPAAAKPAGVKAGAGKAAGWETTTMRTAWSPAAGPAAQEADQPPAVTRAAASAVTGPATSAEAGTAAAEAVRPVAAHAGPAGYSTATLGKPGSSGAGAAGAASGSAAVRPVAAAGARSAMATPVARPAPVGRLSLGARPLSRSTIVALIAIAVCVLVALLAVFA